MKDILTLDDIEVEGKTVLVRIDINTPIDPKTGKLLDDRRVRSHKDTITDLVKKKAKLVLIAHQSRPGEADFTTLENHARWISEITGHEVKYVDSLFSSCARGEIERMKPGEIILLENVRFYSEEVINGPADAQVKTHVVRKLSKVADIYINDAFATAHRSQPSMVGFPFVMKSAAGRLMEKELKSIGAIMESPKKPVTFVLGGTKADDSIRAAKLALENGTEYILTGGVVASIFLAAKGYRLGEPTIEFIRGKKMVEQIDIARGILSEHEDNVITPVDLALDNHDERLEIPVSELPRNLKISDIGKGTVDKYADIIKKSGTIFAKGALGIFEEKNFAYGTEEIIKAIANSKGFSVIGGGHLVAAAKELDVEGKINHISSGGGACISLLAGYKLPAVEALKHRTV
ncbi:MAG: phosphoglycerate kinase [Candidatus Altiarchaeales archaeon]|nr:phosphoglycerate kinase [Candidatus Altiarchaeota archaeon]MBU4342102.1 phosphoglycerate kinase [Candidatus Altiarchaeota archaeon]MBU4406636.1 phosphoglycerate kinase [Candidatus Altiarchaeota archaeon]MBU4437200.1 phosphoglycerate kinase [Candidatus Altiarchaeota archaeon]MCG2782739.1 phosphoglycerate kinase [Candidatus Altiarchaeales archaeon]